MLSKFNVERRTYLVDSLLITIALAIQGCASDTCKCDCERSTGGAGGSGVSAGGSIATGGEAPTGGVGGTSAIVSATGGATAIGGSGAVGGSPADSGVPITGFTSWTFNDKQVGLYVPATSGTSLPIVMYLHACHNDPVSSDYWIISAVNALEPCAVLLPTAPPAIDFTCADWGGTYDQALRPNMVDALAVLDEVIQRYGFDAKRQYLYGESMGGEGVFRLLMDFPTRFAGAVAAAGYTLDKGASQMAQTPLWIFHGSADSISPVENDRAIHQSILDAGGTQVKYTEYDGLEHVPGIERARSEPGLFAWLLANHRD